MNVSPLSSGVNTIYSAQNMVSEAAKAIAQVPTQQQGQGVRGPGDLRSTDYIRPLTNLIQAELQAKSGAELIKTDKEMIGSLLDVMA